MIKLVLATWPVSLLLLYGIIEVKININLNKEVFFAIGKLELRVGMKMNSS